MPLFLANLAMASYFLALCYMLATVLTVNKYVEVRRVLQRHQHTAWSTVQLLILSVALGSFFRTATFSTLCIFDSQGAADLPAGITGVNPWTRGGLPPAFGGEDGDDGKGAIRSGTRGGGHAQAELDFYNKVVAVLFNLPDFLFVSSYLLLVLVWAEAFQSVPLIFYLVAAADLFLPLIIFSTWLYLTLSLSGFPFKSPSAKFRLKRVGRLVMAWSLGRILYSVITLLTFTKVQTLQSMLLVAVFFAAELTPIYLTLDWRLLAMLSVENYEPLLENQDIFH
ncbi:hypothetical protein BBJ28_00013558 [Nothophytophthora sp. Chile5]|nr:hypothetical protein BBJ28_00013558 [Nothophytophthora sp. Chile5]